MLKAHYSKASVKDAKPKGRIAAGFQTRGIIDKKKKWRLEDADVRWGLPIRVFADAINMKTQ